MNKKPVTDPYQAGIKANGIATGVGLLLTLIGLAPIGAIVAYFFVAKAQSYDNPAITGRIVFFLCILVTIVMVIAAYLIFDAASQWENSVHNQ